MIPITKLIANRYWIEGGIQTDQKPRAYAQFRA